MVVDEDARIQSLRVAVDILHTYIGDLKVHLTAPDGRRVALHDRAGGSANDILKAFNTENTPGLGEFNGLSVRGVWSLDVADCTKIDEGVLRRWTLEVDVEDDDSIHAESNPSLMFLVDIGTIFWSIMVP